MHHEATNDACAPRSCHLLVSFCLSAQMNSGQDNSHSKCTLWTRRLGQAKPSVSPPSTFRMHNTGPRPFPPFYSFTLKMPFRSVCRHMLPSLPGCEVYCLFARVVCMRTLPRIAPLTTPPPHPILIFSS